MNWEDCIAIAEALDKQYLDDCPFSITESELIEKVVALPDFEGENKPLDQIYVRRIHVRWLIARGDETYVEPYDDTNDESW